MLRPSGSFDAVRPGQQLAQFTGQSLAEFSFRHSDQIRGGRLEIGLARLCDALGEQVATVQKNARTGAVGAERPTVPL